MNHSAELARAKARISELEARLAKLEGATAVEQKPIAETPRWPGPERDADGSVVIQDGIASYEERQVAARKEWERGEAFRHALSREGVPPGFYRDLVLGGVIRRASDNGLATAAELAQARLEAEHK